MSNVKSIKVTAGLKYPKPDHFKNGTILIVKGDQSTEGLQSQDQFYLRVGCKYPIVNLLTGEPVHWSIAAELKLTVAPPGSSLVISISDDKIKLRLRNKYVKGPKRGTATQI
jgi:hypothetical protein